MITLACFFIGHNYSAVSTTEVTKNDGPWFADERTGLNTVTTEITNIIHANSPPPAMALIRVTKTLSLGDRICTRCGGIIRG